MSQGDAAIEDSATTETHSNAGRMLHQLVHQGRSFSGHERNCCFLNTRAEQFANVSSISGLDLADDARGVSIVDWDQDGDLDVWIVNRNGPQVRFLRNDIPAEHHFVALQLEGRSCNRDAIGARVEVVVRHGDQVQNVELGIGKQEKPAPNAELKTQKSQPALIKTLRAGDGLTVSQ